MTRRTVTAVLGPLLIGLLVALNAPAVSADPPCILDNAGNCAAASGRDFTTEQIAAFDSLSATAPGVTAASGGQGEDDAIRTVLGYGERCHHRSGRRVSLQPSQRTFRVNGNLIREHVRQSTARLPNEATR
jgi:hypothetical protein